MSLPDLTGRRAVVTGANAGLGLVTASSLAGAGAEVLLAVRDLAKGDAAAGRIRSAHPRARVEVAQLDLADLDSVRRFTDARVAAGPLDILVNNAGLMLIPTRQATVDGFELQMGVNHLGHFALTARLMPALRLAAAARVVSLSSIAHRLTGALDPRLGIAGPYAAMNAYSQSKLACALFGFELDRRLRRADARVTSVVAHPGYSATDLFTRHARPGLSRLNRLATPIIGSSPEHGAQPQIRAAVDSTLAGGELIGPRFLMRGKPVRELPARNARDGRSAAWLWERSAELTEQPFELLAG
jgi:NAD(P)-dependent dehydrogenase (short-subunit alcohol dehydrogenase family)